MTLTVDGTCKRNLKDHIVELLLYKPFFRYPDRDELQTIYSTYLKPVLHRQLSKHPVWGSNAKISALAASMVQVSVVIPFK